MDELGQELQTDIEGMDYSAESGRAARSTMDSYIGEIDAALPRVQAAINRLRGSVAAGLGSISAAGAPVGMQRALGLRLMLRTVRPRVQTPQLKQRNMNFTYISPARKRKRTITWGNLTRMTVPRRELLWTASAPSRKRLWQGMNLP